MAMKNLSRASDLSSQFYIIPGNQGEVKPECLRVAAYARVSDEELKNSLLAQIDYYDRLIRSNGDWELVDIYVDEAISGQDMEHRPDLQRLLKACRSGKIDKIITKSVSRFSRNLTECLEAVRELCTLGVSIWFEDDGIETNQMTDELVLTIKSLLAQKYIETSSSNQRWSYQKRMQSGEFTTYSAPYGYKLVDKQLVIDEEKSPIIVLIFKLYLSGYGIGRIIQELEAKNIPSINGEKHWSSHLVFYILGNEKYIGDSLLQKQYTTDTFPYRRLQNNGEKGKFYLNGSHKAILAKNDYDKANELRRFRKAKFYHDRKLINYPLRKKIFCENCGAAYRRKIVGETTYWICYKSAKLGQTRCNSKPIAEETIYSAFIRLHNKLRLNQKAILETALRQLQTAKNVIEQSNPNLAIINQEIIQLKEQSQMLGQLLAQNYLDSALYLQKNDEINGKVQRLYDKKRKYEACDLIVEKINQTESIINSIQKGPSHMVEFNKEIFEDIIAKITVKNNYQLEFNLINNLTLIEEIK